MRGHLTLAVLTLLLLLVGASSAGAISSGLNSTSCAALTTCDTCTANPRCGYCLTSQACVDGTTAGPAAGSTCPASAWIFDVASCTSDSCRAFSTCASCATAPAANCGWCAETAMCANGTTNGPAAPATCFAASWTWTTPLCGAAAQCALATDCSSCLAQAASSNNCGWCASTEICSAGDTNGPWTTRTCPRRWLFNADPLSSSTLQCFQPMPYDHEQDSISTTDWASLGSLGFCAIAVLFLAMIFGPYGCRSWAPQPGEEQAARKRQLEELGALADDDDDIQDAIAASANGGCCSSFNNGCSKFILLLLCLAVLSLSVAALALDMWSLSSESSLALIKADHPLITIEGVLRTRLFLGSIHGRSATRYAYDCDVTDSAASLECQIHRASGIASLVLGSLSVFCSFLLVLMAATNFCCAARLTPAAITNQEHLARIKHPFSVAQWRCAALASVFALASCSVWGVGAFMLSRQYFTDFHLSLSFWMMVASGLLAVGGALLYRHAIRMTPRDGYPLDDEAAATRTRAASGPFGPAAPLNSALGYPGARKHRGNPTPSAPSEAEENYAYVAPGQGYISPTPQQQYQYQPMPPAAQAARFASSSFSRSQPGGTTWQSYDEVPPQQQYQPPPGYVLVPARQAGQYGTLQHIRGSSSEPNSLRTAMPTFDARDQPGYSSRAMQPQGEGHM